MKLLDIYLNTSTHKLNEANLKQLFTKTLNETPKLASRGDSLVSRVRYFGLSKDGTLNFKVGSQSQSGKFYYVFIEAPDIIKFADLVEEGEHFTIKNLPELLSMKGFRVHCEDPSFLYYAFQYMATQGDYEIEPETRAPKRNNTLLQGATCKHLHATIKTIYENNQIRQAISKDIDNYLRMIVGMDYDDYQQLNHAKQIQQRNRSVKWKNKPTDYMNDYFARKAKNHQFLDDHDIKHSLKVEANKFIKANPNASVDDFLRSYFQMTQKAFADDMQIPEEEVINYFNELGFEEARQKGIIKQEQKHNSTDSQDISDDQSQEPTMANSGILTKDSEQLNESARAEDVTTKELDSNPCYISTYYKDGYGVDQHYEQQFNNIKELFKYIRDCGGFKQFTDHGKIKYFICSNYNGGEFYLVRDSWSVDGWKWQDCNGEDVEFKYTKNIRDTLGTNTSHSHRHTEQAQQNMDEMAVSTYIVDFNEIEREFPDIDIEYELESRCESEDYKHIYDKYINSSTKRVRLNVYEMDLLSSMFDSDMFKIDIDKFMDIVYRGLRNSQLQETSIRTPNIKTLENLTVSLLDKMYDLIFNVRVKRFDKNEYRVDIDGHGVKTNFLIKCEDNEIRLYYKLSTNSKGYLLLKDPPINPSKELCDDFWEKYLKPHHKQLSLDLKEADSNRNVLLQFISNASKEELQNMYKHLLSTTPLESVTELREYIKNVVLDNYQKGNGYKTKNIENIICNATHKDKEEYLLEKEDTNSYPTPEEAEKQYQNYLTGHIGNVQKAMDIIIRSCNDNEFITENKNQLLNIALDHDKSKYDKEEYEPYLHHFYPTNPDEEHRCEEFEMACRHHILNNKHHWDYWIDHETLELPDIKEDDHEYKLYCVERVADWLAMAVQKDNGDKNYWYEQNKPSIKMPDWAFEFIDYIYSKVPDDFYLEMPFDGTRGKLDEAEDNAQFDIDRSDIYVHTTIGSHLDGYFPALGYGYYLYQVNSVSSLNQPVEEGKNKYYTLKSSKFATTNNIDSPIEGIPTDLWEALSKNTPGISADGLKALPSEECLTKLSKAWGKDISKVMVSHGIDGIIMLDASDMYDENVLNETIVYNMSILEEIKPKTLVN